jgi:hypothetical protein
MLNISPKSRAIDLLVMTSFLSAGPSSPASPRKKRSRSYETLKRDEEISAARRVLGVVLGPALALALALFGPTLAVSLDDLYVGVGPAECAACAIHSLARDLLVALGLREGTAELLFVFFAALAKALGILERRGERELGRTLAIEPRAFLAPELREPLLRAIARFARVGMRGARTRELSLRAITISIANAPCCLERITLAHATP